MNVHNHSTPSDDQITEFPYAPDHWQQGDAENSAREDGLALGQDHWLALHCLQQYFARHEDSDINIRELKDALDETFHHKGGMRYLHRLFPGGPVAQGCRLAGLPVPPGAVDKSFGSVQ